MRSERSGGCVYGAIVIFVFGGCLVSVSEQSISIPSISALVAAVAETRNVSSISSANPEKMYPRPVVHPGQPAATGWARPMAAGGVQSPHSPPNVLEELVAGWSSSTSTTTPPPSPPPQGWGPPPSPPPSSTTTTPEPTTTTATTTTSTPSTTVGPVTPGWLRCPESDSDHPTYFPHEYSCPYFYQCSHGRPFRLRCRQGLHFNPHYSVCDWPDLARCPYEMKDGFIEDEETSGLFYHNQKDAKPWPVLI